MVLRKDKRNSYPMYVSLLVSPHCRYTKRRNRCRSEMDVLMLWGLSSGSIGYVLGKQETALSRGRCAVRVPTFLLYIENLITVVWVLWSYICIPQQHI